MLSSGQTLQPCFFAPPSPSPAQGAIHFVDLSTALLTPSLALALTASPPLLFATPADSYNLDKAGAMMAALRNTQGRQRESFVQTFAANGDVGFHNRSGATRQLAAAEDGAQASRKSIFDGLYTFAFNFPEVIPHTGKELPHHTALKELRRLLHLSKDSLPLDAWGFFCEMLDCVRNIFQRGSLEDALSAANIIARHGVYHFIAPQMLIDLWYSLGENDRIEHAAMLAAAVGRLGHEDKKKFLPVIPQIVANDKIKTELSGAVDARFRQLIDCIRGYLRRDLDAARSGGGAIKTGSWFARASYYIKLLEAAELVRFAKFIRMPIADAEVVHDHLRQMMASAGIYTKEYSSFTINYGPFTVETHVFGALAELPGVRMGDSEGLRETISFDPRGEERRPGYNITYTDSVSWVIRVDPNAQSLTIEGPDGTIVLRANESVTIRLKKSETLKFSNDRYYIVITEPVGSPI